MEKWIQERPAWCPHEDCIFKRRVMNAICGGQLPEPVGHDGDFNTHRMCLNQGGKTDDYQVNKTDLGWFRWVFDALDGLDTSWLSKRPS